ncbi:MAG: tRNA modification GTPase [Methylobacteriaceae bacterium]|jgi:tRNA modification GTPase|nr:tRNA modification GTPase [Methylobacteriaceae bacterium]
MPNDTIFAMATAPGRAAVAICRVSGPRTREAVARLTGRVPAPRHARLSRLAHPISGEAIDDGLVLFFPAPRSYTGEDCAELQVHGGTAIARAVVGALGALGLRPADPGEFTRRAFINQKLDLTQVEAVVDLVDAETEFQRRQALRQLEGRLSRQVEDWRRELIGLGALVEAELDFSDEGDVAALMTDNIIADATRLRTNLRRALHSARVGEQTRDGLRVVIAGAPNAGKSTFFNALARRDVAIVSVHPGTTRDALEVRLDLGGYPMMIMDTAGLRDSDDPVERIGIDRALAWAGAADLVLWLVQPGSNAVEPPHFTGASEVWTIATKCDIEAPAFALARHAISATTGAGLDPLEHDLEQFARDALEVGGDFPVLTRERHRQALTTACEALERIVLDGSLPPEVVAEEIRVAQQAVGRIAGRVDVEDVLDEVFGRFCIGK